MRNYENIQAPINPPESPEVKTYEDEIWEVEKKDGKLIAYICYDWDGDELRVNFYARWDDLLKTYVLTPREDMEELSNKQYEEILEEIRDHHLAEQEPPDYDFDPLDFYTDPISVIKEALRPV